MIFFFKQKTAYEMRISDWSSDVCSSDLITSAFVSQLNENRPWPVQFVVTTHSPHMANEARFEAMRYFLSVADGDGLRRSVVKDLRQGMGDAPAPDREFLHQYLILTRCDLFFADKAVLIEGTSERLLDRK